MTYRKPRFRQADYEESDDEFVMGHLGMWKRVQRIRGVFDEETRRKPLVFAADAVRYGI